MTDITWLPISVTLGELKPWAANPRTSSKKQAARLLKSWDDFGQVQTVAVGPGLEVYDGHQRLSALLVVHGAGYQVDARQASRELSDDERRRLVLALHAGAVGSWSWDELSGWDADLLTAGGFDTALLADWKRDLKGLDEFIKSEQPAPVDAEPQIDRAAELQEKWQTATGQLWAIGDHRLIVGDCTDRATVARVMGGEKARLVWTDPPYGVNYGDKLDDANPMGYRVRVIQNDDLPADKLELLIRAAFVNCADTTLPGAAIYAACPPGTLLPALIASFAGSGFDFRWQLIWLKDQIVLSRADYHFKHENILYGWKPDGPHYFTPDRTQASVFVYARPKVSEEHPTMKPVDLVAHMIGNSSEPGDIIIDPFGGSGTTMIAAQNLGRRCRMVEISPNYCAVILERMATAFPELVIELVEDGAPE